MNFFAHIELNEQKFAERTLRFILEDMQNTYLESSLFLNILDPRMKYGNLTNHIGYLKERLSKLQFIIDYDEVSFNNNITGFNDNTFETAKELNNRIFSEENFSKEIFWSNRQEENDYKQISFFECFEDRIIEGKRLNLVMINAPYFNSKNWIFYYQRLLDHKFPEFSEKMVIGKTIIKYRFWKGKYFVGIETDYQSCNFNFKKGWWEEPDYKLIIFEKKTERNKILKILSCPRLVHPHFNPPTTSFPAFFGSKTRFEVSEIETVNDNGTRIEYLDDGKVRLYNNNEFSDDYKRHAYYYFDILSKTAREYIKFIEESFEPYD